MEFKGHVIKSEIYTYNSGHYAGRKEVLAWDNFLAKLAVVVRAAPADARFVWRVRPRLDHDAAFDRNETDLMVIGRVIECIGDGELPHCFPAIYDDSPATISFGLAQK